MLDQYVGEVNRLEPMGSAGREDGHTLSTAGCNSLDHRVPNEYHEGIMYVPLQSELKPLLVVQPDGPNFNVTDENLVSWQKWRLLQPSG